jgi:hypothetical protein
MKPDLSVRSGIRAGSGRLSMPVILAALPSDGGHLVIAIVAFRRATRAVSPPPLGGPVRQAPWSPRRREH